MPLATLQEGFLEDDTLHSCLHLKKGSSLWLSPCLDPGRCVPWEQLVGRGVAVAAQADSLPLSPPLQQQQQQQQHVGPTTTTLAPDFILGKVAGGRYDVRQQPYFLSSGNTSLTRLQEKAGLWVLEQVDINIAGHTLKVHCLCVWFLLESHSSDFTKIEQWRFGACLSAAALQGLRAPV